MMDGRDPHAIDLNKVIGLAVPKSVYVTGMTADEARRCPSVIMVTIGMLPEHTREMAFRQIREPQVCIAYAHGEETVAMPEPMPRILDIPVALPTFQKYQGDRPPKLSRHDLNPRKGRR